MRSVCEHACVYIIMYFIIDWWTYSIPMAWAVAGTGVLEEGKSFSTPRMYISAMDWGWGERKEEGEIPDQGHRVESVRTTLPPTRGVLVVKTSSSSGVDMTHGAAALTTNDDNDDAADAGALPASGGGAAAAAPCRTSAAAAAATVEPGSTPAASFNAASRGGGRSLGSQGRAC